MANLKWSSFTSTTMPSAGMGKLRCYGKSSFTGATMANAGMRNVRCYAELSTATLLQLLVEEPDERKRKLLGEVIQAAQDETARMHQEIARVQQRKHQETARVQQETARVHQKTNALLQQELVLTHNENKKLVDSVRVYESALGVSQSAMKGFRSQEEVLQQVLEVRNSKIASLTLELLEARHKNHVRGLFEHCEAKLFESWKLWFQRQNLTGREEKWAAFVMVDLVLHTCLQKDAR